MKPVVSDRTIGLVLLAEKPCPRNTLPLQSSLSAPILRVHRCTNSATSATIGAKHADRRLTDGTNVMWPVPADARIRHCSTSSRQIMEPGAPSEKESHAAHLIQHCLAIGFADPFR